MSAALDSVGLVVGLFGILYAGAVVLASREGGEFTRARFLFSGL